MGFELSPGIIAAFDQRVAALNKVLDDCVVDHTTNVAEHGREMAVLALASEAHEMIGIPPGESSGAAVAAELLTMAIDRLSRGA